MKLKRCGFLPRVMNEKKYRRVNVKSKKIILAALAIIIGIFSIRILYFVYEINFSYKELPFEYAGSASGKLQIIVTDNPEKWAEEKYVYSSYNGYFILYAEEWDFCARACEFSDLDFEPQFEENQVYICTYGYRLKTLEYSTRKRTSWSKGYYNRATLWTDDYQEGTFFFYKIGEIGKELGTMLEDNEEYSH